MISIVAVMLIQITNAQIVYSDVNPDLTTSGSYNLDLNNDGIVDFVITHTSKSVKSSGKCKGQTGTNQYIKVTPLSNNKVADAGTNARKMATNQTIDANVTSWGSNIDQVMFSSEFSCAYHCFYGGCGYYFWPTNKGEWYPANEDGFLGLRLISGGHTYYGWVRMNISSAGSAFIVKDYAYNGTAGQAILAGQTSDSYIGVGTIIAPNPLCAANSLVIPYVIAGTFSASNIITAELSDATGNFANPVSIGSVVSNFSGNINAVIPALTLSGDNYRIRVTSSNPAETSLDNGNAISIAGVPLDGTIVTNQTNICPDNGVYLRVEGPEPCYSYQWKQNGIDIPGATNFDYSPLVAGDYSCVITAAAGSVTSNTIKVTAEQQPAIITAYTAPGLCGDPVNLTNTGSYGALQWKLNGNSIPDATSWSYWATTTGNYSCIKTNNCGSVTSNTIAVTIYPYVADAIITAAGPTTVCSGQIPLNANTGSGLSYQWYYRYDYNSQIIIIAGATGSSYMVNQGGDYWVHETNSVGCTRISNIISTQIGPPHCNANSKSANASSLQKDISTLSEDFHTLSIAPNPVSGSAKVSFNLKKTRNVSLAIYDISGRLVKTIADKKFDEGIHEINLNTNNMNPGIYLLRMESEGILQTRKFIVIK
jgi:hypothetical protein